jgi:uncharacterized membrane protein YedE/YeeE
VTEAMRASARQLGIVVAAGVTGAVALGLTLAIAQNESILRWIAYMLYVAGAAVVGFAFFTGAPASPRKLARQEKERVLQKAMDEQRGVKQNPVPAVAEEATPFASELVLLVFAGALLFGLGILLEVSL